MRNFFLLLFPADSETTRSAFSGGLPALIQHPEQLQQLRDNPGLMKTAAEKMVRWMTPSIYKRRTVTQDTRLGGKTLWRGNKLTIWEISANRDEQVFEDPFTFNIVRLPNRHVGYGYGAHICLGAGLARLELKIDFEELPARISEFQLAGESSWISNNRLLGLRDLPLTVKFRP